MYVRTYVWIKDRWMDRWMDVYTVLYLYHRATQTFLTPSRCVGSNLNI